MENFKENNEVGRSGSSLRWLKAALAIPAILVLLATGTACAHRQAPVTVAAAAGQATVDMKASDFKFTPNNIQAKVGDQIEFRIENVTGSKHNFTLQDPAGKTVRDIDLPAHQTTTVTVIFSQAGTYPFHCDVDLHRDLGMKGQVVVT